MTTHESRPDAQDAGRRAQRAGGPRLRSLELGALLAALCACSGGATTAAPAQTPPPRPPSDTSSMIPAGFGSLRQEDISITVATNALRVRALPLDEDIIRTLAPDSYRSMQGLRESKRAAIDAIARRTGASTVDLWYVNFYNQQQGEAPIAPRDITLTNQGRDFKPVDIIPITQGIGELRVKQGQTETAILVFDASVNPNQPLTMRIGTQTGANWESVLQRVEAERSKIRARGGK